MWDPNTGLWVDDVYRSAGPSGGATGALDLMNTMQSGQNYNQEHSAKMLAVLSQLLSNPNAPALTSNPMAATATDMTPDQVQQAYQQTPRAMFNTQWAQASPEQRSDPNFMQNALISSNLETPTSASAYARMLTQQAGASSRNERSNMTRAINTAIAQGMPPAQIVQMFGPEAVQAAGYDPDAMATMTTAAALPAAKAGNLQQKTQESQTLTPVKAESIKAGTANKQAQTQFVLTKNNWYPLIASAQAQSLLSSAGHKDALTAATDLATSLKGQEAGGAMTHQMRVDTQQKATHAVDALRRMQADPSVQAAIKKNTPEGQTYAMTMKALQVGIQQAIDMARTAPSVVVPKGGQPAAMATPARVYDPVTGDLR